VQQHQQLHLRLLSGLVLQAPAQQLALHLAHLMAAVQLHQLQPLLLHLAQEVHLVLHSASAVVPAAQQPAAAALQVVCLAAAARLVEQAALLLVPVVRLVHCHLVQAAAQQRQVRPCLALQHLLLPVHLSAQLLHQQLAEYLAALLVQQEQQVLARPLPSGQQQHHHRPSVAQQQLQAAPLALPHQQARLLSVCRAAHQLLELQRVHLHLALPAVLLALVLVCLVASAALHRLDSSSSSSSLVVTLHHHHLVQPLVSQRNRVVHLVSPLHLGSSSSSQAAALGSQLHSGKQRHLPQRLARLLHLDKQQRQRRRLARPVHLVALPAARLVEGLLHLLLRQVKPLGLAAVALLHLLRLVRLGLVHWLVVGLAAAHHLGVVHSVVRQLVVHSGLHLHQRSSRACGEDRAVEICRGGLGGYWWAACNRSQGLLTWLLMPSSCCGCLC
jgi:hypothetical protein